MITSVNSIKRWRRYSVVIIMKRSTDSPRCHGFRLDSAQPIIAEVDATTATFPSANT